jgi:poly-gamma-glutamate synthesis protein (capsule biosynthesis protein)
MTDGDRGATIEIALLGDVNLTRGVGERLRREPPAAVWCDTLPLLAGADLRIANLECTFADAGAKWRYPAKKYFHRVDERNVAALTAAGIDIAVLANNHTFDYGVHGLLRTLRALDSAGIAHFGAGTDRAAAEAPAVKHVRGTSVGIVGFMDDERWSEARPGRPGRVYSPLDLGDRRAGRVLEAVRRLRPDVDLLIASAHWGPNWGDLLPEGGRQFGRALVAAGADLVFGHSGHVTRGIELVGASPILHSTGDALDPYTVDPRGRNDHGAIFTVRWDRAARRVTGLHAHPIVIRGSRVRLAPAAERPEILGRLAGLCADLGTTTRTLTTPTGEMLEVVLA